MEELSTLVKSLDRKEIESLKRYLTCFGSRKQQETQSLRLLEIILGTAPGELNDRKCSQLLFRRINMPALGMLKNRLYNKVFDCLLIDINLDRNELLDETDEMIIRMKKKSAIYNQLLYSRPSSPLAQRLLGEVIDTAVKYEHYYAAVEHLRHKKWRSSIRENEKLSKQIEADIVHYENCAKAVNRATDYYYEVIRMNNETSHLDKIRLASFLETAVAEVAVDEQLTGSLTVKYYLNWLRLAFANLRENYTESKRIAEETIAFLNANKAVYRRQRIAYLYGNLSRSEIYLGNYETATRCALLSEELLPITNTINYFITKEQQFLGQLYSNNYRDAGATIRTLITAAGSEVGSFSYSRYVFYHASLLFAQGEYAKARTILARPLNISRDKAGWEMGIRILRVMIFIELRQLDEAGREISNLKRFVERSNQSGNPVGARSMYILRILQGLEICGFNFEQLDQKILERVDAIAAPGSDNGWKPFSEEIIPFHYWIGSKLVHRKSAQAS